LEEVADGNISGLAQIYCISGKLTLITIRQVRERMKEMDDDDDDDVVVVVVVVGVEHAQYGRTVQAPHPRLLQLLRSVY
jgi:hypothetical protein